MTLPKLNFYYSIESGNKNDNFAFFKLKKENESNFN